MDKNSLIVGLIMNDESIPDDKVDQCIEYVRNKTKDLSYVSDMQLKRYILEFKNMMNGISKITKEDVINYIVSKIEFLNNYFVVKKYENESYRDVAEKIYIIYCKNASSEEIVDGKYDEEILKICFKKTNEYGRVLRVISSSFSDNMKNLLIDYDALFKSLTFSFVEMAIKEQYYIWNISIDEYINYKIHENQRNIYHDEYDRQLNNFVLGVYRRNLEFSGLKDFISQINSNAKEKLKNTDWKKVGTHAAIISSGFLNLPVPIIYYPKRVVDFIKQGLREEQKDYDDEEFYGENILDRFKPKGR